MLHAGSVPSTDLATWDFRVFGEVESPLTLSWDELQRLPSTEIELDIHCVTRWSRFDARFRGVHWSELAKLVRPKPSGRYVVAHAEQGFTANVPLRALEDENALIAYEADGEPLDARPRLAAAARGPDEVLLEERQVAARHRAHGPATSRASGSATATTTTPTTGRRSDTSSRSSLERGIAYLPRRLRYPEVPTSHPRRNRHSPPGRFPFWGDVENKRGRREPAPLHSRALPARELVTSSRPCRACPHRPRPAASRAPRRRSPRS